MYCLHHNDAINPNDTEIIVDRRPRRNYYPHAIAPLTVDRKTTASVISFLLNDLTLIGVMNAPESHSLLQEPVYRVRHLRAVSDLSA